LVVKEPFFLLSSVPKGIALIQRATQRCKRVRRSKTPEENRFGTYSEHQRPALPKGSALVALCSHRTFAPLPPTSH
jgi:hypothetical protein